jgi:nucleoside phosphorylase
VNHSLITFAVKAESRPFSRWLLKSEVARAWAAPVGGPPAPEREAPHKVNVVLTGIGPGSAEQALRRVLTGPLPARTLTCGFAGGLNPSLPFGAVVFSADEDFDLGSALVTAGARPARFHHADRVMVTAAEKRMLRQTTGADAVEMESETIRLICREHGIPSATVRVISDVADEDLPLDFNRVMDLTARLRYDRLVVALLKSPKRIPGLIRLGFRARRAARELADVLSAALRP